MWDGMLQQYKAHKFHINTILPHYNIIINHNEINCNSYFEKNTIFLHFFRWQRIFTISALTLRRTVIKYTSILILHEVKLCL